MSGTKRPNRKGEVRVGVPPNITVEAMAALWLQMLAQVEKQMGAPVVFDRIEKVKDSDDHEFVYRKAT